MALSLTDLCLLSIQKGLDRGRLQNFSQLPPNLREKVLEMVLCRSYIDERCTEFRTRVWIFSVELLTSPEFLDSFKSLNFQRGISFERNGYRNPEMRDGVDDHFFLDRVSETLAGESIGHRITELKLNIYDQEMGPEDRIQPNLPSVARLIGRCPKLQKLDLRFVKTTCHDPDSKQTPKRGNQDGLITIFERYGCDRKIIQNLTELSIIGNCYNMIPFLTEADLGMTQFENLRSLIIVDQHIHFHAWEQLLRSASATLESLVVKNRTWYRCCWNMINCVGCGSGNGVHVLPVPLPKLTRLKLCFPNRTQHNQGVLTQPFVENLIRCPKLRLVQLKMTVCEYKPYFSKLANSDFILELDLSSIERGEIDLGLTLEILQPWLITLGVNITNLRLYFGPDDGNVIYALLKNALDACRNLRSFKLIFSDMDVHNEPPIPQTQMTPLLSTLLCGPERVKNLRSLSFYGQVDYNVLMSLFENCPDLEHLDISDCPQLDNQHLIEWSNRGGGRKLRKLKIYLCENCSYDGAIPVSMNCGDSLTSFVFRKEDLRRRPETNEDPPQGAIQLWQILTSRCRYLRCIDIGPVPRAWPIIANDRCFPRMIKWGRWWEKSRTFSGQMFIQHPD